MKNTFLTLAVSMSAAGVICGGTLIAESATGKLIGTDGSRATGLFLSALNLTGLAALPLQLAGRVADAEAEAAF